MNQIAAVAVALREAATPEFKKYAKQIVKNAATLADTLSKLGWRIVSGGTDSHLILVDTWMAGKGISGSEASERLEKAGIIVNKNTIPKDPGSPYYPSGVRLGTPALTTRGIGEKEMKIIGKWIADAIKEVAVARLPGTKEERIAYLKKLRGQTAANKQLAKIRAEIKTLCKHFPLP